MMPPATLATRPAGRRKVLLLAIALLGSLIVPILGTAQAPPPVSLTKQGPPDAVAGDQIELWINLTNQAGGPLSNLSIVDDLPQGMVFNSSDPAPTSVAGSRVWWNTSSLPDNTSAEISLLVDLDPGTPDNTTLTNTASANASEMPEAMMAQHTVLVHADEGPPPPPPGGLMLDKSGPTEAPPGAPATFTLTIDNAGQTDLANVTLVDRLPQGLGFLNATPAPTTVDGGNLSWSLGVLAANDSLTVTLETQVDQGVADNTTLQNTAEVSADGAGPIQAQHDLLVRSGDGGGGGPVLSLVKSGPPDAFAGQAANFTLTLSNDGPTDATNLQLEDTLPPELVFTGADQAPQDPNATPIVWQLGTLASGQSLEVTVETVVDPSAPEGLEVTNQASLTADGLPGPVTDDHVLVLHNDGGSAPPPGPGPGPGEEPGDEPGFGPTLPLFGGVVNVSVLQGGSPTNQAGDVFVMPAFDPDGGSEPPPCEPPMVEGENKTLGTCTGAQINTTTGGASLRGLADGTYDLNVFLYEGGEKFVPQAFTVSGATVDSHVAQSLNISLPEPGYITGTVVADNNGTAVANARVEVFSPTGFGENQTAADGSFNISTAPGNLGLRVVPPSGWGLQNHEPPCNPWDPNDAGGQCINVTKGATTDVGELRLGAGGTITGRLIDTDGAPLEGDVNAFSVCQGPSCEPSFGFTRSDPSTGTFTLAGLAEGTYVVEAFIFTPSGEQRALNPEVSVTAGNTTDIGDIEVGGGKTIKGQVTGSGGLQDVEVIVFEGNLGGGPPGFPLAFQRTDANGDFTITGLPNTTVSIEFMPPFGDLHKRDQVAGLDLTQNGDVTWINVSLPLGKQVKGFVTDPDGNPVGNADVGLFPLGPCDPASPCGGFSWTNGAGEFSVGGLDDGSLGMFVQPPPGLGLGSFTIDPKTGGEPIQITANDTTLWRNVTLTRGGEIRGNVTNAGDGFAWVSAFGPSGFGGAPLEGDGSFRLEGLATGTYTLSVEPDPFTSDLAPAEVRGIEVTEGETTWIDDVTLSSGACITGTVEQTGGAKVQSAFVDAFELIPPGSEAFGAFGFDQTDANGQFSICGLTDGDYGIHIEPPFGSSLASFERFEPAITLSGGDVDLGTLTLAAGKSVTGRVLGPGGQPIQFGFVGLWDPTNNTGSGGPIQPDGSFDFSVPQGTYDVEVFPDPFLGGNLATKTLPEQTVGSSGLDLGDIQLSQGGTLIGRLVDAGGQPVAFADVDAKGAGSFGFATSSSEGRFRIPGLSVANGSQVDLNIRPGPGSSAVAASTSITWNPTGGVHDAGNITLGAGWNLTVTVQDSQGNPLAGADVEAWPSDASLFGGRIRETGASGQVTLRGLPNGTYDLAVRSDTGPGGFFPANATIAGADASATLSLGTSATLTVTVEDAGTSQPVAGAEVEAFNATRGIGALNTSNGSGQAALELVEGTYTVKVKAPGYAHASEASVAVAAGGTALTVELTQAQSGTITGSVTGGSSVANVTVIAQSQADAFASEFNVTASDGSFTLPGVPTGTYDVFAVVGSDAYGCQVAQVTSGATVDVGSFDLDTPCGGES